MEAQAVLNELVQEHDDLSMVAVFDEDPEERDKAFIKAEALRSVLQRIKDNLCKTDNKKDVFQNGLTKHYESFARRLFYNRNAVKE